MTTETLNYLVVPYGTKYALRAAKTGYFVCTDLGRLCIFSTEEKALAEAHILTERDRDEENYDYRDHCSLL
jgi:hypothetical protein